jgi:uncharacterized protein
MFHLVLSQSGPEWDRSRPMEAQTYWDEHAAFMDALVEDGLVVLGGPLGDGRFVLLAIDSDDEAVVRARLAADPWLVEGGVLQISRIEPWTIFLDGRA